MTDPLDEFDDPALKDALRRAFAHESGMAAPSSLRRQVETMLSAGAAAAGQGAHETIRRPQRSWWRRQLTYRTGIAAAVAAIAVGFLVVRLRTEFAPTETGPTYYNSTAFPASLASAMVKVHDASTSHPAAHLSMRSGEPSAMKSRFSAATGVTVAAVELGSGWKFVGAGLCQVDGQQAAELLFKRGDDSVSVFSMRAPASCANGSGNYEQVVAKHPIAGVITRGAIYCVVGFDPSGELTMQQLQPLLTIVEADVAEHGCAPEPMPVTAVMY